MVININTTQDKIFEKYLEILNPLLGTRKLTSMEIKVLAKLLYLNSKYSTYLKEDRDKILFHRDTKERIRISLDNKDKYSYNNIMTSLRKKGMISNKSLNMDIDLVDGGLQIHYNLKVTNDQSSGNKI